MNHQRGMSLVEMMVALAIGSIMIAGAIFVYAKSRDSYSTNDAVARLQETARYALSIIEPDVRMSNYWGLVKGAGVITDQASPTDVSGGGPDNCGTNFARNLLVNLQGSNNGYTLGCAASGGGAVGSSDTLTVRRASAIPAATSTAGTLQICSTRLSGRLYSDGGTCTGPGGQVNDLIVSSYYVSQSSHLTGLPALHRWTLVPGPALQDVEIIPGVEDLQVQFGIDLTGTTGVATQYVNPDAVPAGAQVVSVRLWLLVRSENPEVGFVDGRTYEYADRVKTAGTVTSLSATGAAKKAYAPGDRFRRLLVSRTIQIRNALGT